MRKVIPIICAIILILLSGCVPLDGFIEDPEIPREIARQIITPWIRTVGDSASSASAGVEYNHMTIDSFGNIYIVGTLEGNYVYDFGNGVTANGVKESPYKNGVLVKYDKNGSALWARTALAGSYGDFNSVAVDNFGNVYITGAQGGSGVFNYGNGVNISGISGSKNAVLIKYNTDGQAQWARMIEKASPDDGYRNSSFNSVAVASDGNVYVAGNIHFTTSTGAIPSEYTYYFGPNSTVEAKVIYGSNGTNSTGINSVLVKYNSVGDPQWARTVKSGTVGYYLKDSSFSSVAVFGTGDFIDIYVAGYQDTATEYRYDPQVLGSGQLLKASGAGRNSVLLKYTPTGHISWVRTVLENTGSSKFNSIAVDSSGDVYAVGHQATTGNFKYGAANGDGVSVAATNGYVSDSRDYGNSVIVKFRRNGTAEWARTIMEGISHSTYHSVTIDNSGNIFTAGYQYNGSDFKYGNNVVVNGAYNHNTFHAPNAVVVMYNADGEAKHAMLAREAAGYSEYNSVAVDNHGNVYIIGILGWGNFDLDNGSGPFFGDGAVLVKYPAARFE